MKHVFIFLIMLCLAGCTSYTYISPEIKEIGNHKLPQNVVNQQITITPPVISAFAANNARLIASIIASHTKNNTLGDSSSSRIIGTPGK